MSASMMFGGGCCLVGSPWLLLLVYGIFGPMVGNSVLLIVAAFLILVVLDAVNSRRTTYYLTTGRLVEVRGGLVQDEMPLELAREASSSGTLEVKPTYREGASQFYDLRIRHPSSRKLFYLSGLDEDSKELVLKAAHG